MDVCPSYETFHFMIVSSCVSPHPSPSHFLPPHASDHVQRAGCARGTVWNPNYPAVPSLPLLYAAGGSCGDSGGCECGTLGGSIPLHHSSSRHHHHCGESSASYIAHVCSNCLRFRVEVHGLWLCGGRRVSWTNSPSLLTHPCCCCKVSALH